MEKNGDVKIERIALENVNHVVVLKNRQNPKDWKSFKYKLIVWMFAFEFFDTCYRF